jgi:hypothetical protein
MVPRAIALQFVQAHINWDRPYSGFVVASVWGAVSHLPLEGSCAVRYFRSDARCTICALVYQIRIHYSASSLFVATVRIAFCSAV